MNQIATRENSINSVTVASGANGSSIAPQNLGEVVRFAEVMCKADIALPKHLRGNAGACMAVAMQALEWQMSPFAVASKSYSVNGAIAYEAQLIAAVVNTRSGIKGRLKYAFNGSGNDMTCTVTGMLDGEECEYTSPTIGTIPTKNSPLWKSDPQQQLGYFSARSWARRHCPEVLLGVYDRDEAEQFQGAENAKDVTPSIMQRLQQRQTEPSASEGFDKDFVTSETETLASTTINEDQPVSDVATSKTSDSEGGDSSVNSSTLDNSAEQTLSDDERETLKQFIIGCAAASVPADGYDLDPAVIVNTAKGLDAGGALISKLSRDKAGAITRSFKSVCEGKADLEAAIEYSCSLIGIERSEVQS